MGWGYNSWDSAPTDDDVFNDQLWLNKLANAAEEKLRNSSNYKFVSKDYALPVVSSMTISSSSPLKILDYGGGLGASYFPFVSNVSHPIEFYIIETEAVCDKGKEVFKNISDIRFYSDLSKLAELKNKVDIIHLGSTFQYINDQKHFLRELAEFKPRYLLMTGVLAGDIKSFVTIQKYHGKNIRVRFVNIHGLIESTKEIGFDLMYKTFFSGSILGESGKLPMSNFDDDYQLDYPCQLLFKYIKNK